MKRKWNIFVSVMMTLAMLVFAIGVSAAAPGKTFTPFGAPLAQSQNPTPTPSGNSQSPTATPSSSPQTSSKVPAAQKNLSFSSCPIPVKSQTTITFSGWGGTSEQDVYKAAIKRFEKICPLVTVNYNPIPSNFDTKLKAEMAAGSAPDVFYVDSQLMDTFAPEGQLLPLGKYLQQAGVTRSSFIPQLLTIFTYKGKTYGLPKDWGTLGLVYLPEAFTAAGIPMPNNNWTFQDMINAANTIAKKTKYAGFCQAPDWARFAPWVFSNGGTYTNQAHTKATLNTPKVEQMATELKNLYNSGGMKSPSDLGVSWCGPAIGNQLAAMTLEGGWMVQFMHVNDPNVTWKAVEVPKGPTTRADVIFTNAIGINANTAHPDAAAAFLIYLTSPQNQAQIESTGFAYSTHPWQIQNIKNTNNRAIAQGGLLNATNVAYWGPQTGNLETYITNALNRSIYLKQQTVQQAFNQAQLQAQSKLSSTQ